VEGTDTDHFSIPEANKKITEMVVEFAERSGKDISPC